MNFQERNAIQNELLVVVTEHNKEFAPNLIKVTPKQAVKQRTISQALDARRWVSDIKGALTVQILAEYLLLWDMLDNFGLQQNVPDQHICCLTQ